MDSESPMEESIVTRLSADNSLLTKEFRRQVPRPGRCSRELIYGILSSTLGFVAVGRDDQTRVARFGLFEVDLQTGELRKNGLEVRLQQQPFRVLSILLEKPGKVVTREELRQRIWPDGTFVDFEHSLNKAINKLREALGDSAGRPRFIETLPRRGYRFIGPVETAPEDAPEESSQNEPHQPGYGVRRHLMLATVFAGVVLVAGGAFLVRSSLLKQTSPPEMVPITSLPGQEYDPAFSPDGKLVAYSWDGPNQDNQDIYVQQIGAGKPLRLTTHPQDEGFPTFSPDGKYIAFRRGNSLMMVPVLGGAEKLIAELELGSHSRFIEFTPDGRFLALADRASKNDAPAIHLVSVATGEKRRFTNPPSGYSDFGLRFSPDGRSAALVRGSTDFLMDVCIMPASGGEPSRLIRFNNSIGGIAWTPDNKELLLTTTLIGVQRLWRVPAAGGKAEPVLGAHRAAGSLAISRLGHLVFMDWRAESNIWELLLPDTKSRPGHLRRLIAASGWNVSGQFSPDGSRIAFVSDRSGCTEIWTSNSDGSDPRQLTFLGAPILGALSWSPDGKWVAFDAHVDGNPDIYVVGIHGAAARRVTTKPAEDVAPSWSRDGQWIYFGSRRAGQREVWKVTPDGRHEVRVTKTGGFYAMESADGKTLYYTKGEPEWKEWQVWHTPTVGGEENPLLVSPSEQPIVVTHWGLWSAVSDGIYFVDRRSEVRFYSFLTGQAAPVFGPDEQICSGCPGLGISPDRRRILYTRLLHRESDIMLIKNFR